MVKDRSRHFPRTAFLTLLLVPSLTPGCAPKQAPTAPATTVAPATEGATAPEQLGDDVGGRLFDRWYRDESTTASFRADVASTPAADGGGGPNGDGTLNDASGTALLNAGHDYRLKNLFGWDLRGAEGIYGPSYQNKRDVLPINLLTDTRSADELAAWFAKGGDGVPAMGEVLRPAQLRALADFVIAVRTKELPHPDQIWSLSADAPKHYTLVDGADMAAGSASYKTMCAGCHGDDGAAFVIDDDYTLGSYARTKAYEAWIKIVNGQPGTGMGRQTDDAAVVLNVLAALCDREAYPPKDAEHDAPDGDLRCGAYLR